MPEINPEEFALPYFTDIESVGAAGRHMSIFEMGGAHAFNYPDKEIYWKDQTVSYHHKLLTDVMGVPSESITYKEHFWSGGGNAGPDLEGIVSGLEISTLVFMQYKVQGEELMALPIRTVDTGYGMERWAWLSQGSPSGFHAVYGPLLAQVMELAKVDLDENTLSSLTRAAGIYGEGSRAARETISKGSEVVLRLSKELSSQGIRKIPTDQLVLLYDSQGLAPEIVQESAEKVGVEVEVPENFLTLVAERHSKPTTSLEASSSEPEWEAKVKHLPGTRALYYDDAYQTGFQAKILARVAENAVVW